MAHKYASAGEITEAILANTLSTNIVLFSERRQRNCVLGGGRDLLIQIVFPTKNSTAEKPAAISVISTVEMPLQPLKRGALKKTFIVEDENL